MSLEDLLELKDAFPDHQIHTREDGSMICPSCSGAGFQGLLIISWDRCSGAPKDVSR